jgi:hypothetical protein
MDFQMLGNVYKPILLKSNFLHNYVYLVDADMKLCTYKFTIA